jgi:hypothetical protein
MGKQEDTTGDKAIAQTPRSLAISTSGVTTATDFATLMSAVMSDVIDGRLPPPVANAVCNAGGKLLKVVEMQYKYASQPNKGTVGPPDLQLAGPTE